MNNDKKLGLTDNMKTNILLVLILMSTLAFAYDYPESWWAPFPHEQAYVWEVLPQEGIPGKIVILSKRNELGILSNFAATPFVLDEKKYESIEGLWQCLKYPEDANDPRATFPGVNWPHTREQVCAMTSFDAKHAGNIANDNMKLMGINWVTYMGKKILAYTPDKAEHYQLIVRAMRAKIDQNPEVKRILLATGDLILKPDHKVSDDAPPSHRYFDIYMEIRSEFLKTQGQ